MLTLIYWAACVAGCYFLAKSQGRDTTTAAVLGLLFTVFALIYEGENETYIEASVENSSSILYDKEIRDKPRTRHTKRNV